VPERVLRAQTSYRVPSITGLELSGQVQHEGSRPVLPDNSITLPAWTRLDASLRYTTQAQGTTLVWTAGVDNLTDKRYWKEAPYQYGHVYLFPGAARTFRIGLSANL
jgi:iron complex outermembrane receptor protein